MHRFFVDSENIKNDKIYIAGSDAHHISRVLRCKINEKIMICDGKNNDYMCEIAEVGKNEVLCNVLERKESASEPSVKVTLFQGLPKASKMEMIIQKSVEIGVFDIIPCKFERCVVKAEKTDRWQKIAEEAAKQCGRGIVPKVGELISTNEMIDRFSEFDIVLFAYELESTRFFSDIFDKIKKSKRVAVVIGPEGGFTNNEASDIIKAGAVNISLGKRILRTETAGLVCVAGVMLASGEY